MDRQEGWIFGTQKTVLARHILAVTSVAGQVPAASTDCGRPVFPIRAQTFVRGETSFLPRSIIAQMIGRLEHGRRGALCLRAILGVPDAVIVLSNCDGKVLDGSRDRQVTRSQ
jgi:hypothetical protein